MINRSSFAAIAALAFMAAPAHADTLFFKDGRFYEVPKLVETETGFDVHYDHGTVKVRKEIVKDWFIEQAGAEPVASNDADKEKIAKGLVPFEGKWLPANRRDAILAARNKKAQEQIAEYRKHQNWRDRYQIETKHFQFEFTVPLDVGQQYMDMFEVYYETFAKVWKIKQPRGKKLKVCFYNNADDFHRIGNVSRGVLGYFRFVDPIELNFFYERRDLRLTLDVLFHELNHYLYYLYTKDNIHLPQWVEEGMAEYYGASKWDPTTKKMTVGELQEGRLVTLINEMDGGNIQDLRALMSEPAINATQYAWSWTLCHMLMEDKKYRAKFIKFIDKLARGRISREPNPRNTNYQMVPPNDAIATFQQMLGIKDLDAFEADWYEYIKQLDVQSARGYHRAAMFCIRWDRPLRAGLYFKKAIDEHYSTNPDTYREYGSLLIAKDEPRKAIPILETGINLDPLNADLWHQLGRAYREAGGDDNREKGKDFLILAHEIDPQDLGLLFGLDSDVLEALEG